MPQIEETEEHRIERIRKRLNNEESPSSLKLWRSARTPKESDNDYDERKERENLANFERYLFFGKINEDKVTKILISKGMKVTDISNNFIIKDGVEIGSPFDLVVVSPSGKEYIADVKGSMPSAGSYHLYHIKYSMGLWHEYRTSATKVIIFYSDASYLQEYTKHLPFVCRCIKVEDLKGTSGVDYKDTKELWDIII